MSEPKTSRLVSEPERVSTGGRPKITPSDEDRDQVLLLVAAGWTGQEIAEAMGICRRQLYRTFGTEMVDARAMRLRLDAELLFVAAEQAIQTGKPSSIRTFVELMKDTDAARIEGKFCHEDAPRRGAPDRSGKKAAAIAAAERTISTYDDDWGDDLNPHAVN
jgi:hypothetical protein